MSIMVSAEARIRDVKVTADAITAYLVDGRIISVPLAWSWRLSEATPTQRTNCQIIGDGQGVHWPEVDEDISAEGMLHGTPARRPRKSVGAGASRLSHPKLPNKAAPAGREPPLRSGSRR